MSEGPHAISATSKTPVLRDELSGEIWLMLRFAWSRGVALPEELLAGLDAMDRPAMTPAVESPIESTPAPATMPIEALAGVPLSTLAALHAGLTRAIAPALPVTLCLMGDHADLPGWIRVMGPIPNVRLLLGAAFSFLALFVALSVSPYLTAETMNADIYGVNGMRQLAVLAFLLSAAGIGATFQALFTAQRFVSDSNYDPRYDGSYWILIGLGLVAGLLLSVLLPLEMESASSPSMAKPLLALLGGFSAGLVYRILQRLVDTVDSLFQPRSAS
ncbi:hypothetical protein ACQ86G_21855 [Roseateles chitinivorans]|uniref:hypothetical protein n=1 Tax=Roseateles chitinivorans TaxID=2917965 RepID=UPI003D67D5E2